MRAVGVGATAEYSPSARSLNATMFGETESRTNDRHRTRPTDPRTTTAMMRTALDSPCADPCVMKSSADCCVILFLSGPFLGDALSEEQSPSPTERPNSCVVCASPEAQQ